MPKFILVFCSRSVIGLGIKDLIATLFNWKIKNKNKGKNFIWTYLEVIMIKMYFVLI